MNARLEEERRTPHSSFGQGLAEMGLHSTETLGSQSNIKGRGKSAKFLVGMGVAHSVMTEPLGPVTLNGNSSKQ